MPAKKKIDAEQVRKLTAAGLTVAEIGVFLGCSRVTLWRRFESILQEGRELQRASLKRKQHQVAMRGNARMLMWLGVQYLGQSRDGMAGEDATGASGPPLSAAEAEFLADQLEKYRAERASDRSSDSRASEQPSPGDA